ncbi:hypothetical protein ACFU7D_13625 [Nocardioides sp. NPDC057577]|uniref:hypothetical protein n=1 Tax=Nocardioides sp. NPDC057577 TaxID=3346171 RepID=UPI00366EFA14
MYLRPGRSTRLLALAILGLLGATLLTAAPASANTAPRITKATISTWMPVKTEGLIQWTPAFSYAASDDQGVTGFQVQRKGAPWSTSPTRRAKMSAAAYVWRADGASTWLYPSRTSVRGRLDPGAVDCFRVRAKDAAGLTSAWTGWRCAHAPMRAAETWSWCCQPNLISGLHLDGSADGPDVAYVSTRFGTQRSNGAYCAKGVRLRVFKGPGQGKMNVFLGSSKVGTVSAWSRTSGWKWATVRRSTDACGRVRLVPLTRAPVQMTRNYMLY